MTAEQARSQATIFLGEVESGGDPIAERKAARAVRTFREIAADFMEQHVGAKRKPKTVFEFGRLLDAYVLPAIGTKRIVDVSRADVARVHSSLKRTPRQANLVLLVISAVWGWAARRDEAEFARNPAASLERYPEKKCERFLSSEELARLGDTLRLAELEGLPWEAAAPQSKHGVMPEKRRTRLDPFAIAAIRLLILSGMRPREVLDLEWRHVDFERGALFLPDSKTGRKTLILGGLALDLSRDSPGLQDILLSSPEGASTNHAQTYNVRGRLCGDAWRFKAFASTISDIPSRALAPERRLGCPS